MPRALLNFHDTGPVESLAYMLSCAGYECYRPAVSLGEPLPPLGPAVLTAEYGYREPTVPVTDDPTCDIVVDVKAHANGPHLSQYGRVVWHILNGGHPSGHDPIEAWLHPKYPVVTPCQWYHGRMAYVFSPPFLNWQDYAPTHARRSEHQPVCLVHDVMRWGYGKYVWDALQCGIRIYGRHAPDGVLHHSKVSHTLSTASCMVHLKTCDAFSYALIECAAARCPFVCTSEYIANTRMEQWLQPGKTCLTIDPSNFTRSLDAALEHLSNPSENARLGDALHDKMHSLQWRHADEAGLRNYLEAV